MKAARKTLASDIFVPSHMPHLHYRKKWVRTHKKVGTNKIFLPCKPYVPCVHEMDPDSLFSGLGAIGGYGSKTEKKKTNPQPFCCSKTLCKRIFASYHLLHVSLPCFTVVSRMCTIALFNHKPNLIVKRVNGKRNWSGPGFFCSVTGNWDYRQAFE